MRAVSKETLRRIVEEFPTLNWADEELEELVAPRYGVITGFHEILREIKRLQGIDLEDIGLAGGPSILKESP